MTTGSLHQITLEVNGVPHQATVPARRLLSDALRHDLGLTGTHVGCEHGVCGTCTVLLDGEPVRSCLMFAVQAEGHRITTVEGLAGPGRRAVPGAAGFHRMPRAAVRVLHAGIPDHDHGAPGGPPRAVRQRDQRSHRRQPVPVHRLPEHQIGCPPRRRNPPGADRGGATMTTIEQTAAGVGLRLRRAAGRRAGTAEDDRRLVTGQGLFTDDIDGGAYGAAFVRSPYAHARVFSIDVSAALEVAGLVAIYTHDDLPASARCCRCSSRTRAFRAADRLPAGRGRGAPCGRGGGHGGRHRPLCRRGRGRADLRRATNRCPRWSGRRTPPRGARRPRGRPGQRRRRMVQEAGDVAAAIEAAPHRLELRWDITRSCSSPLEGRAVHARWDAADQSMRVYTSSQLPVSVRAALASRLDRRRARSRSSLPTSAAGSAPS